VKNTYLVIENGCCDKSCSFGFTTQNNTVVQHLDLSSTQISFFVTLSQGVLNISLIY